MALHCDGDVHMIMDAMSMAQCLRVLLVEDSKVLTERLTEAIRQIPQVELIGTADTEATAVAVGQARFRGRDHSGPAPEAGHRFRRDARVWPPRSSSRESSCLTNYDLPEYKNAAIALGATHFLDKARDYGRLPEVLARNLRIASRETLIPF